MEELRKEWLADGEDDFTDDDLREAIRCEDVWKSENHYTKSEKSAENKIKGESKKVTRKVDTEKVAIIDALAKALTDAGYDDVEIRNKEKYIDFGKGWFEINLTKHSAKTMAKKGV